MAIVNSVIRLTGGIVVAVFQYMSDKNLYQLMSMEGTVEVLRGGKMIIIDQTEVVPGDIVRLVVSRSVHVVMIAFICSISKPEWILPCFKAWRCVLRHGDSPSDQTTCR
jgi:hypothetical protein